MFGVIDTLFCRVRELNFPYLLSARKNGPVNDFKMNRKVKVVSKIALVLH